ncbi:TetR/AcrR family transcriptional regulator [Mariniphaga sediminis]|uniref:TetR/AcrR family transcriptional regulator n=1 Tax=Mariniphaga sediminis TaxID=1628158 RepID=A0A399CYH2_9BACT|nr:TetR/AcrR family transcriptional regulator [Mariniphaga sediminis]RIH64203.1 TetR/AcrR family transcriptional regulator [Mariniphaga sediminis]RIH66482.1 TetR/AcrR family transcriptional regulator [Mariniphaga sediminis]
MTTEEKILNVARKKFVLYGYYGTTIREIAFDAEVNKGTIHYYFRSKDKLYGQVVSSIAELLLQNNIKEHQEIFLFIVKELQNNRTRFLNALNVIPNLNWSDYLITLIKNTLAEISPDEFVNVLK